MSRNRISSEKRGFFVGQRVAGRAHFADDGELFIAVENWVGLVILSEPFDVADPRAINVAGFVQWPDLPTINDIAARDNGSIADDQLHLEVLNLDVLPAIERRDSLTLPPAWYATHLCDGFSFTFSWPACCCSWPRARRGRPPRYPRRLCPPLRFSPRPLPLS